MKIIKHSHLAVFADTHHNTVKGILNNPDKAKDSTKKKLREQFPLFKKTVLAELSEYERKINSL